MRRACWISSRAPCKRIACARSISWHNMSACMTNHVRKCLVVVPSSLQGCRHTWGGRPGRRATVGLVSCWYESKKHELVCWEGTLQTLTYTEKRLWEDSRMECHQLSRFIVFHTTAHHDSRYLSWISRYMHTYCIRQIYFNTQCEHIYDQSRPKDPHSDPINMSKDATIQIQLLGQRTDSGMRL